MLTEQGLLERLIEEASRRGFVKHQLDDAVAAVQKFGESQVMMNAKLLDAEGQRNRLIRDLAEKDQLVREARDELADTNNRRIMELMALRDLLGATLPFFRSRRKPTKAERRQLMNARAAALKAFDASSAADTVSL